MHAMVVGEAMRICSLGGIAAHCLFRQVLTIKQACALGCEST